MEPKLIQRTSSYGGKCVFAPDVDVSQPLHDIATMFLIPSLGNTPSDRPPHISRRGYIAVWHIDRWVVERGSVNYENSATRKRVLVTCGSHNFASTLAAHVDPRMTRKDIDGATRIFPNAANDGWLFGHSHDNEHHDAEAIVEAMLISHLTPHILRAQQKVVLAGDITTRTLLNHSVNVWLDFLADTQAETEKAFRNLYLGHHGLNLDTDNHRAVAVFALRGELAKLIEKAKTEPTVQHALPSVQPHIETVIASLTDAPAVKVRWEEEDANLKSLTLERSDDGGTTFFPLGLDFDTGRDSYSLSVLRIVDTVRVTPIPAERDATVKVTIPGRVIILQGGAGTDVPISTGSNAISIEITAKDGKTVKSYVVTINKSAGT